MRSRRADTDVVMFVRTLAPGIAGGTRAVLQRAAAFADAGYQVSIVATQVVPDDGAWARNEGLLHPRARLLQLWRDAPRAVDRRPASSSAPVTLPRIPDGEGVSRRRRTTPDETRLETWVDGRRRTREHTDARTGSTTKFSVFREDGTLATNWFLVDDVPVAYDDVDERRGLLVRHFFVDGRDEWLVSDVAGTVGTGSATLRADSWPRAGMAPPSDYASVIAAWLDDEFATSSSLVVFADGENVWQRTLRHMRHPRVRGVSVLHNSHLDAPYDESAPTKKHWAGFFDDVTNVDTMVCLTDRQREHLLHRYPGLPLRVLRHAASRPAVGAVRRDPRTVVFVGRLAGQKQLDHLVRAFALVLERVPDAVLDVYGAGPEATSVREHANRLGITERVRMRGLTDSPLEAFASARVAAMSSFHEGLPLTITEAMSVGTPYVAYDCHYGPAELIRDGIDGFVVPRNDVEALAGRLVEILQDDRLARRTSRRARRVVRRFSTRRYRRAWLTLLDEVAR